MEMTREIYGQKTKWASHEARMGDNQWTANKIHLLSLSVMKSTRVRRGTSRNLWENLGRSMWRIYGRKWKKRVIEERNMDPASSNYGEQKYFCNNTNRVYDACILPQPNIHWLCSKPTLVFKEVKVKGLEECLSSLQVFRVSEVFL